MAFEQPMDPVGHVLVLAGQVVGKGAGGGLALHRLADAHALERHLAMLAVAEGRWRIGDDLDADRLHRTRHRHPARIEFARAA
jgi:hypothetical protein